MHVATRSLSRCIHTLLLSTVHVFLCSYFFDGFCLINGLRSIQLFINGKTSPSRVNCTRIQNMFSPRSTRRSLFTTQSLCYRTKHNFVTSISVRVTHTFQRVGDWCIANKARIITTALGSRICLMTKTLRTRFTIHNCTLLAAKN